MRLSLEQIWPRLLRRTVGQLGWLQKLNVSVPVRTPHGTVHVPFLGGHSTTVGGDLWMTTLLEAFFAQTPGTFIDVGVNLGQSLLKAKLLDPERSVVGFEPNPACLHYVRELIRVNELRNVELVPAGLNVSDAILTLELFSASGVDSAASIVANYRPGERVHRRVHVPVVTWATATVSLQTGPIGVVKIDVEGAEREVLETMTDVIASNRPFIIVEVLPAYRDDNLPRIERQNAIERWARNLDYRLLRVMKQAGRLSTLQVIDGFGIHGNLDECDYVMCPAARLATVANALPVRGSTAATS